MKRVFALLVVLLVGIAFVTTGFAQEQGKPAPEKAVVPEKPAAPQAAAPEKAATEKKTTKKSTKKKTTKKSKKSSAKTKKPSAASEEQAKPAEPTKP